MTSVLAVLMAAGCIFDSEPEEPGFPSQLDATISFQAIGDPVLCKCMSGSGLALVAAGTSLGVIDIQSGQSPVELALGVEIDDIADSDAAGYAWVLADSLLYPVDLSGPSLESPVRLGGGGSFVTVSSAGNRALVSMNDDSITLVDLTGMQVTTLAELQIRACQGMAFGCDETVYAALGSEGVIAGYETENWTEIGRVSVPGDVIDLFPGPSGYICVIVNGSNELWFIRTSDCKLYSMTTFPETPLAAASMPDGSFAYATCAGSGLMVVAENGQIELRSQQFGMPSSIDISPDGSRAVLCSTDERRVYVLVK
ncbi:MAG: WD40 repeat domain-containing protein [Candidatus Fermentibacteraceae bacterium]|nr:WD40 repeat domain-containing protein [Candidatus Fermentibacteraceae bacterium]